jgi:hypothetical protein
VYYFDDCNICDDYYPDYGGDNSDLEYYEEWYEASREDDSGGNDSVEEEYGWKT